MSIAPITVVIAQTVLIALLMMAMPWLSRRGLLFGVYVGDLDARDTLTRSLRQRWLAGMLAVTLASLGGGVYLSLQFQLDLAPTISVLVLVAGYFLVYAQCHRRARDHARSASAVSVATLTPTPLATRVVAWCVPLLSVACAVATLVWVLDQRAELAAALDGELTWGRLLAGPVSVLILAVASGGMVLFLASAKRSLRYPEPDASIAAQHRFHRAVILQFAAVGLFLTIAQGALVVAGVQQLLDGESALVAAAARWLPLVSSTLIILGIVLIAVRYGQGGAHVEGQAGQLTDGLADNRRWLLGLIYYAPDDPSYWVEQRFGIGYTINFGNARAVVLLVAFLALIFSSTWLMTVVQR